MKRPTITHEDVLVNGTLKRKYVLAFVDTQKPYTPQDGLETQIGNLSHMVRCNIQLEHKACYLSKLNSGNPFDLQVLANRASSSFEKEKSKINSKNS